MERSRFAVFLLFWAVTDYVRSSPLPRDGSRCSPEEEYFHGGLCCQRCPAGSHAAAHCQKDHGVSPCSPCKSGKDFTEHPNGLAHCLTCNPCRDDQEMVKECTPTSNAVCRCNPGTFAPESGSEVCYTCRSCPSGVKEVCTDTANTVCAEDPIQDKDSESKPPDGEGSSNLIVAVLVPVVIVGVILIGLCIFYRQKMNCNVCSTSLPGPGSEKARLSISETSLASNGINITLATPKMLDRLPHEGGPDPAVQKSENGGNSTEPERERLLQATDESRTPNCNIVASQQAISANGDAGVSVRSEVSEIGAAAFKDNRDLPENSNPTKWSHDGCPEARVPEDQPVNLCAKTCASQPLSDDAWSKCFYCFIEEVSYKDWKRFMRTINLKNTCIDRIIAEHPHSVQEQQYHMLAEWRMQYGFRVSVHTLLDALSEMKFEGCRENVVNALRSKDLSFLL